MVVHSAHRLHMPSLLPADPPTPYLTPHNKLQCRLLAILDNYHSSRANLANATRTMCDALFLCAILTCNQDKETLPWPCVSLRVPLLLDVLPPFTRFLNQWPHTSALHRADSLSHLPLKQWWVGLLHLLTHCLHCLHSTLHRRSHILALRHSGHVAQHSQPSAHCSTSQRQR